MGKYRIHEMFSDANDKVPTDNVCVNYRKLYKQERDWTCSIACLRSLLSNYFVRVPEEKYIIDIEKLEPSASYSKDIKNWNLIKELDGFDVKFGCDYDSEKIDFNILVDFLRDGYGLMVQSMYSYDHWFVMIGYFVVKEEKDLETNGILVYDPYYDDIKYLNADEFCGMWQSGEYYNNHVSKDFIAIKKVK